MSDYLTREFKAQLTTSMDSILRRAVFEIMMIFENSLHDHQLELRQKGEEIAQLIIKLQKAEIKQKESEFGVNREEEMNTAQREPVDAPQQASDVPEIDFEVPDDWCAPLGCEITTKKDYTVCPSVRLRKLSIPLWPIPAIKQEVVNHDIDSHQQEGVLRRSKRGSTLNKTPEQTQDSNSPVHDKRTLPTRNDMKKLLKDIKQESSDVTGGTTPKKRGRKRKEENEITATEAKKTNDSEKRFCKKVFDSEVGRGMHTRSHKRCRRCKKVFPYHTTYCKKLTAKEAWFSNHPKPESCEEEKLTLPGLKQEIVLSFSNESSRQKNGPTRKYSCEQCNKAFHKRCKLKEHLHIHTGEKPYPCSMCPKKFRLNQSRKKHIMRMHKDETCSSEINGHLAWTKPLEETQDDHMDLISLKKDKSQAIKPNVQRARSTNTSPSSTWRTMGTRCYNGFSCLLCHKVSKDIYLLIEHFRIHTGEKPLKCDKCPAAFRCRGQLSMHRKKCRNPKPVTKCKKCKKKFIAQEKYIEHMSKCHKEWPIHCKVCGKGFFMKGRLSNHMERLHK